MVWIIFALLLAGSNWVNIMSEKTSWPFPGASGPIPWTKQQEREYAKQQKEQQQDEQEDALW